MSTGLQEGTKDPPALRRRDNYYRRMMRRRAPWFVVIVLFLAWATRMVQTHLPGDMPPGPPPVALEESLVYFDRNLRAEEAAQEDTGILRWLHGEAEMDEMLELARDSLEDTEENEDPGAEARRALAVIREELGTPQTDFSKVDDLTVSILNKEEPAADDRQDLVDLLSEGDGRWWDTWLAARMLEWEPDDGLSAALAIQRQHDRQLYVRSTAAYGCDWLISLLGLFFIPHALRTIRRGWTIASLHRPVRYGSRWEPSLVVSLFLAADLLAEFFYRGIDFAAGDLRSEFAYYVGSDTVWRLLAPGLALCVLFRKPSHAIRALGLNAPVHWHVVLGTYAFLSWVNHGFNSLVEPWMEFDPTGGLDLMEDGWGGLFYALLSACILAPVAEEVFYRGLLLRGLLRRSGFWVSAGVVSVTFALGHYYDVFGLISVGFMGLTMAILYRTTGSLVTVIVLHALYNFTITMPQWLLYHAR